MSLAELAGARRMSQRDPLLRAPARRVRARRGRAPVGRGRQRVPRLPLRHLRHEHRSLPPAGGRGRARAGRAADARQQPFLHRARDAPGRAPVAVEPRREGVLLQLRRRGVRGRDQARPQGASGGDVVSVYGAFHGRTYGALSATPQESKQAPFAPLVPGFRAVDPTPEAIAGAVDGQTAAVLLEPIQGESGVNVLSDETLRAAREACDEHGAALDLRRGSNRDGPHRHALGLRADRRHPRCDHRREGARRRTADRCARHRPAPGGRARTRRPWLHVRRRPRRSPRRRSPRWT